MLQFLDIRINSIWLESIIFFLFSAVILLLGYIVLLVILKIVLRYSNSTLLQIIVKQLGKISPILWVAIAFVLTTQTYITDKFDLVGRLLSVVVLIYVLLVFIKHINRILTKYSNAKNGKNFVGVKSNYFRYFLLIFEIIFFIFGSSIILSNFGFDIGLIVSILGFGSFAITFAMRRLIRDVFGSVIIVFTKYLKPGDYIETGSNSGWVESLDLKSTTLRTKAGEKIVLPNSSLIDKPFTNSGKNEYTILSYKITIATKKIAKYSERFERLHKRISKNFTQIKSNSLSFMLNSLEKDGQIYILKFEIPNMTDTELEMFNRDFMLTLFKQFENEKIDIESIEQEKVKSS